MTPAARMAIKANGTRAALDVVAAMAQADHPGDPGQDEADEAQDEVELIASDGTLRDDGGRFKKPPD